jgi:hypothetical protein
MIPDPFQNSDPLWQPFDPNAASANANLAMPDTTASGLGAFLRSDEATTIITARQPLKPTPARESGWRLGHITGFPD